MLSHIAYEHDDNPRIPQSLPSPSYVTAHVSRKHYEQYLKHSINTSIRRVSVRLPHDPRVLSYKHRRPTIASFVCPSFAPPPLRMSYTYTRNFHPIRGRGTPTSYTQQVDRHVEHSQALSLATNGMAPSPTAVNCGDLWGVMSIREEIGVEGLGFEA
ncbi:hypothetical protein BDN70DRAFT_926236 [Pholiota conissans]|uniref:Uncharacterized protein n=1 Tax=Pholiota conissans TaxID=109636 RepID=A0A9P5YJX6_9AGAR|nr:hypothetical protein BDN70DRAFT_926236 [Pholiota conissans]